MPELPEVETTRLGIEPHLVGRTIVQLVVREPRLRWPVDPLLQNELTGKTIHAVGRRGKYLLLETGEGCIILHLGMSGSLRILPGNTPPQRHDHLDLVFSHGYCLRLRDPRRFGAFLWTQASPFQHPLLRELGPEPWDAGFHGEYLCQRARGRSQCVKSFLMDSRTVVGVGNIYASEALFEAGIHPSRAAGRVSVKRYEQLAGTVREVLDQAIQAGGTTLRDFVDSSGRPGYFAQSLKVYQRAGAPCVRCGAPIEQRRLGQRASYFCPRCQR
jgi:formamidopyrimidine-DNA glycosylase